MAVHKVSPALLICLYTYEKGNTGGPLELGVLGETRNMLETRKKQSSEAPDEARWDGLGCHNISNNRVSAVLLA